MVARYKISERIIHQLDAANHLFKEVQDYVHLASLAAQHEWAKLKSRLPSPEEIGGGVIGLSESDIDEVLAKARRFLGILQCQPLPSAARAIGSVTVHAGLGERAI